jgi:hypothetical protein
MWRREKFPIFLFSTCKHLVKILGELMTEKEPDTIIVVDVLSNYNGL